MRPQSLLLGLRDLGKPYWLLIANAGLLIGLACGCSRVAAPSQVVDWRSLRPGLSYAAVSIGIDNGDHRASAHVVRFDPSRYELQVVLAAETGASLAQASAFRQAAHGLVAFNGGYFDHQWRPLGLLVSRGAELSPLRKVDHGVFALARHAALVRHARQWLAPPDLEFALECGPRLLIGGQAPHFRSADRARRTALALDDRGRVVVAVTEGVVSLAEFANWLSKPATAGGVGATEALNLDGGPSSMLEVAVDATFAQVLAPTPVPVGVAIVERK